jgi:hypothetical protein
MIYMTFERGSSKFSNNTTRTLAYRTAVQLRQLRAKWLLGITRFFAFVSSLKLSRRLLCSVRFVFVSTFNLQRRREFVVGITSLNKYLLKLVIKSIFLNHALFHHAMLCTYCLSCEISEVREYHHHTRYLPLGHIFHYSVPNFMQLFQYVLLLMGSTDLLFID